MKLKKILISLLVLIITGFAAYKVKVEWVDLYKHRQTVNLWLLCLQLEDWDKASKLVSEDLFNGEGFHSYDTLKLYYSRGYFDNAFITEMYFDINGFPTARVRLPEDPDSRDMLVQVRQEKGKFRIEDIRFVAAKEGSIFSKILNSI